VHPNHATIEVEISLACVIGEVVATAAITIAAGLEERGNGGLRPETRQRAGDLVAALFNLHQKSAGAFDFLDVSREYGKLALRARYTQAKRKLNGSCPEFNAGVYDTMVEWPLNVLSQVIAAEAN
jgi:hypothetical protein